MNRVKIVGWKCGFDSIDDATKFVFDKIRANPIDSIIKEHLGLPYDIKKDYLAIKQLNALELEQAGGDVMHHSAGFKAANYFFPHRLYLSTIKHNSPVENIENDQKLASLLQKEASSGSILNATNVITIAGNLLNGYQLGNFCPGIAKYIYEKFAPYKQGKILDMSAGFGGRLIAAVSSKYQYEYTGVDPSTDTVWGLAQLARFLKADNRVTIIQKPFEDSDPDLQDEYFDIAFTSPPYFKKEIYSNEETQSWKRYSEYDSWVSGFLYPLISISKKKIKPDRYLLINIENVLLKDKQYNVEKDTVHIAKKLGLEYLGKRNMLMSSRVWIKGRDTFRRESIFIFKKN